MNIKSIISKIKLFYKKEYLQESELKELLAQRFRINYLNFKSFCIKEKVNLPESAFWDFFVSQNLTITIQLIKNCYLIDLYTSCKIVTDSLRVVRDELLAEQTIELKILRIK